MTTVSLASLHWHRELAPRPFMTVSLPARTEVVIIGGGYVGATTAYWLAQRGVAAVLLERRDLATGATGRNAGFIAPGLGHDFLETAERYGMAGAHQRLAFVRRGGALALALIRDLAIDCELEQIGGLTLAMSTAEWIGLRADGEARQREGIPAVVLSPAELAPHFHVPVPPRFQGGVLNPETAVVNPAKLARGIAAAAAARGAQIFTGTEVFGIADEPDGRLTISTSRGDITAGWVVLATNAWSPLVVGYLKDRIYPVRGQVLATAPAPPTLRRALSANHGYEYWSQRADGTIVLGGARWATADRDEGYYAEEVNPEVQAALDQFLYETFPTLAGVPVVRRWSGIMGFSVDGFPFIGPLPGRPRLLIAAGYTGHGGPYFAIAAHSIAELIVDGRSSVPLDAYALDRPLP